MTFTLTKEQYELAKSIDFSELAEGIRFSDTELSLTVPPESLRLFQVLISEEIDVKGFSDNQEKVTPYGRRLYALYDAVYATIHATDFQP